MGVNAQNKKKMEVEERQKDAFVSRVEDTGKCQSNNL